MSKMVLAYLAAGLCLFWTGVVTLFVDLGSSGWWFVACAALWIAALIMVVGEES